MTAPHPLASFLQLRTASRRTPPRQRTRTPADRATQGARIPRPRRSDD